MSNAPPPPPQFSELSTSELLRRADPANAPADPRERVALAQELRRRQPAIVAERVGQAGHAPAASTTDAVRVVDVDMPFGSMVRFMVKWTIASIPALIILAVLAALLLVGLAPLVAAFRAR